MRAAQIHNSREKPIAHATRPREPHPSHRHRSTSLRDTKASCARMGSIPRTFARMASSRLRQCLQRRAVSSSRRDGTTRSEVRTSPTGFMRKRTFLIAKVRREQAWCRLLSISMSRPRTPCGHPAISEGCRSKAGRWRRALVARRTFHRGARRVSASAGRICSRDGALRACRAASQARAASTSRVRE